jgi:hypothetical protein
MRPKSPTSPRRRRLRASKGSSGVQAQHTSGRHQTELPNTSSCLTCLPAPMPWQAAWQQPEADAQAPLPPAPQHTVQQSLPEPPAEPQPDWGEVGDVSTSGRSAAGAAATAAAEEHTKKAPFGATAMLAVRARGAHLLPAPRALAAMSLISWAQKTNCADYTPELPPHALLCRPLRCRQSGPHTRQFGMTSQTGSKIP